MLNTWGRMPGVQAFHRSVLDDPTTWPAYDLTVEVDWARDAFKGLPDWGPPSGKPSVCWMSDTHWSPESFQFRLDQAHKFSIVFCCQLDAVKAFREGGVPCWWLPHAAEHTCYTPPLRTMELDRRWNLPPDPEAFTSLMMRRAPRFDWVFVGYFGQAHRVAAIEGLCDEFPSYAVESDRFFEDAAAFYHQARIVFNHSVKGELNMRSFEVLASRSFLLSDRQQGMKEAGFEDGENCALYDTLDEAHDKMAYWLDDQRAKKRDDIADAGWRMVLSRHTYRHRAIEMLTAAGLGASLDESVQDLVGSGETAPA